MILHPGVISLLIGSLLVTIMLCYSAYEGAIIARDWDINSGSERQLGLERKTYLVSTMMTYAMGFQLLSLFLFIATTDALSHLFIGAMCAAGSLNVNAFGYPTMLLKLANFVLGGIWLIVNAADNRGYDYPLIRIKYILLICLSPLLLTETLLQGFYLLNLSPNLITSCCSVIFAEDSRSFAAGLATLPRQPAQLAFILSAAAVLVLGIRFLRWRKGAVLFALAVLAFFAVSLASIVSFVSLYIYELPTHHCPFCILHAEYGYIGYPLYLTLLLGTISGTGVGALAPFGGIASLAAILPSIQRRLTLLTLLCFLVFLLLTGASIGLSNLDLSAY
ncbi:MAG: hypothetical protein F9K32_17805 [Desulfobulbaceae bacterium]|nr:MAG: hypothetical protein F9K32_17805 [Desulfobulbaceae bacterium]